MSSRSQRLRSQISGKGQLQQLEPNYISRNQIQMHLLRQYFTLQILGILKYSFLGRETRNVSIKLQNSGIGSIALDN
jgi:hypothetical protein